MNQLRVLLRLLSPWAVCFLFILGLAVFTRFWHLGSVPQGMTWDEVSLGYIGKMVITTGRDEHSNLIPITFQSFGDFKAPLAFYSTGISTTLLGVTPFATRLPFAVAGVISVLLMTALCGMITRNRWYGLLGGLMLTVSPWHILFSRVGFEAGLSLCFFLLLLTSWCWARVTPRSKTIAALGFIAGSIGFLYVYHAAKIVFPPVLLLLVCIDWRRSKTFWKKNFRTWIVLILSIGVLSLPLLFEMMLGPGLARAGQTSFLGQMSISDTIIRLIQNLGAHLSPRFLVQGATTTLRHGYGSTGVLLLTQFALLLLGITFAFGRLAERCYSRHSVLARTFRHWLGFESQFIPQVTPSWFWLLLIPLALLPALIGNEIPHANRALLAIVPMIILAVLGVRELQSEVSNRTFSSIAGTLLLVLFLEFASFWQFSITQYPINSSKDWLEGYETAVKTAADYSAQGERVKFTTGYGEPQIFYAFFNDVPLEVYRNARVPEIEFGEVRVNDLSSGYDVLITAPNEALPVPETRVITRSDGKPAFLIYELN